MDKKMIGIVVADTEEFKPFLRVVKSYNPKPIKILNKEAISFCLGDVKIICALCGIGKVNAASMAAALISMGANTILNFGLSGGIGESARGGLLVPERFLEHDFDLTALGYKVCEKPNQKYIYDADTSLTKIISDATGAFLAKTAVCGDRFISSKNYADYFEEAFGAKSCDMESAAIASVCDMADIPFAALRRISDDAGDNAEQSYTEMNTSNETYMQEAFLKALVKIAEYLGGK